jgi:hypothetical protein
MPSNIGRGGARNSQYTVSARFDGFTLSAEVTQISTALQNKQLATAVRPLDDKEELTMAIPFENLKLVVTTDAPETSTEILGRFTLRDRRSSH